MRKLLTLAVIVVAMITTSCTSKTEQALTRIANTPVLILDDSVNAINYKHVKNGDQTITILTINFQMKGKECTAITSDYVTAYATTDKDVDHDIAIGYFIKNKYIRAIK